MMHTSKSLLSAVAFAAVASQLVAQEPSMMRGINWRTDAIYTIGTEVGGFTPTGIPDGMAAYPGAGGRSLIYVNSELNPGNGYAYTLANGVQLTGARVQRFEVERVGKRGVVHSIGMAFDKIYDRDGSLVVDPSQVNETGNGIDGLARFCSGTGVLGGTYSFVEDIFFAGEETSKPFHPHGGTVWAIDVDTDSIHAVPALGRGAWENLSPVETNDPQTTALLLGDDTATAALYLWIGTKNAIGDQSFLDRNGLKVGQLYYWKTDNGDTTPEQFHTKGSVRTGVFEPISPRDVSMAGQNGHDAEGYLDGDTLRIAAQNQGAFRFSRPEDIHVNPQNGQQLVFASTGRGAVFPSDNWGTTYIVDINFGAGNPTATLTIAADSDFEPVPDAGIRSPDNLTWATDGYVYIQEDRSTSPSSLFGGTTGREASIWRLDPVSFDIVRVGEMNRAVVLPVGSTDGGVGSIGNWESSGIIDVTHAFPTEPGEVLLLANVQAHGIQDGPIGGNPNLDEGGQLVFMSSEGIDHAIACEATATGGELDFALTNGTPNAPYAMVFAAINAGNAPNGWFYGIDVTFREFSIVGPPLLGFLDADGNASFEVPVAACPLGLTVDVVTLELSTIGAPIVAGPAVTHRL